MCGRAGPYRPAEKLESTVILIPFAVVLSAVKNLALPLRVNYAKDLALSIFRAMRDSSSPLVLCRNSMNYSFKFSGLVKADGRSFYPLFRLQNVFGAVHP